MRAYHGRQDIVNTVNQYVPGIYSFRTQKLKLRGSRPAIVLENLQHFRGLLVPSRTEVSWRDPPPLRGSVPETGLSVCFANDPDRRMRLEREGARAPTARLATAVKHPRLPRSSLYRPAPKGEIAGQPANFHLVPTVHCHCVRLLVVVPCLGVLLCQSLPDDTGTTRRAL